MATIITHPAPLSPPLPATGAAFRSVGGFPLDRVAAVEYLFKFSGGYVDFDLFPRDLFPRGLPPIGSFYFFYVPLPLLTSLKIRSRLRPTTLPTASAAISDGSNRPYSGGPFSRRSFFAIANSVS
jgi:hypothetical protein